MPDPFEYIECWVDDTIGKPPWDKSCPDGEGCNDDGGDNGGLIDSLSDGLGDSLGDSNKRKGMSKDAKLTITLCFVIPLLFGAIAIAIGARKKMTSQI